MVYTDRDLEDQMTLTQELLGVVALLATAGIIRLAVDLVRRAVR